MKDERERKISVTLAMDTHIEMAAELQSPRVLTFLPQPMTVRAMTEVCLLPSRLEFSLREPLVQQ
jgi:hypothetical protein